MSPQDSSKDDDHSDDDDISSIPSSTSDNNNNDDGNESKPSKDMSNKDSTIEEQSQRGFQQANMSPGNTAASATTGTRTANKDLETESIRKCEDRGGRETLINDQTSATTPQSNREAGTLTEAARCSSESGDNSVKPSKITCIPVQHRLTGSSDGAKGVDNGHGSHAATVTDIQPNTYEELLSSSMNQKDQEKPSSHRFDYRQINHDSEPFLGPTHSPLCNTTSVRPSNKTTVEPKDRDDPDSNLFFLQQRQLEATTSANLGTKSVTGHLQESEASHRLTPEPSFSNEPSGCKTSCFQPSSPSYSRKPRVVLRMCGGEYEKSISGPNRFTSNLALDDTDSPTWSYRTKRANKRQHYSWSEALADAENERLQTRPSQSIRLQQPWPQDSSDDWTGDENFQTSLSKRRRMGNRSPKSSPRGWLSRTNSIDDVTRQLPRDNLSSSFPSRVRSARMDKPSGAASHDRRYELPNDATEKPPQVTKKKKPYDHADRSFIRGLHEQPAEAQEQECLIYPQHCRSEPSTPLAGDSPTVRIDSSSMRLLRSTSHKTLRKGSAFQLLSLEKPYSTEMQLLTAASVETSERSESTSQMEPASSQQRFSRWPSFDRAKEAASKTHNDP